VRGTKVVKLSATEFELLDFFLRHQGEVVRREDILHGVWPNERAYESNIVDIYVHYLRNKIERRGETQLIQTVPGVGYMLKTWRAARGRLAPHNRFLVCGLASRCHEPFGSLHERYCRNATRGWSGAWLRNGLARRA
jgi:Transcriptional regulatory protein, C terminal